MITRRTPLARSSAQIRRTAITRTRTRIRPISAKRSVALVAYRQIKAETWARDGGRCRHCGAPATDPHHLRYRSARGDVHTSANLLWLCRRCHTAAHALTLLIWYRDANDLVDGVRFCPKSHWTGLECDGYHRHAAWKTLNASHD